MKHTNESIDRLVFGMAYYCKKKRLPLIKRVLNRLSFWTPNIDCIVSDIEPAHISITPRIVGTLEEGE